MAKLITDANFKDMVINSAQVAVVDFWATWCGPCRAIAPIIEELSNEYAGKAVIGKVDVDSNPETAMEYNIRSIPTILIIKNGEVVHRHVGTTTKADLKSRIDKFLS